MLFLNPRRLILNSMWSGSQAEIHRHPFSTSIVIHSYLDCPSRRTSPPFTSYPSHSLPPRFSSRAKRGICLFHLATPHIRSLILRAVAFVTAALLN